MRLLPFYFLANVSDTFTPRNVRATHCLHETDLPSRNFHDVMLQSHREGHDPHDNCLQAKDDASMKQIVFIRHGQTYMNELIGGKGTAFGQPDFTDIFDDPDDQKKYHDSPLSDVGIQQARALNSKLHNLRNNKPGAFDALGLSQSIRNPNSKSNNRNSSHFLNELDLVVVSPLTRALQTLQISLYEHIIDRDSDCPNVPILATPLAAERLYLVSDLGKPRSELRPKYPFVDFDTSFSIDTFNDMGFSSTEYPLGFTAGNSNDIWHFSPTKQMKENYTEWRPNKQGQLYACLGEPSTHFDRRMSNFYFWLESRKEKCIAIVSHAGVIDWMTSGQQYSNCELRLQTFSSLQPRALQDSH